MPPGHGLATYTSRVLGEEQPPPLALGCTAPHALPHAPRWLYHLPCQNKPWSRTLHGWPQPRERPSAEAPLHARPPRPPMPPRLCFSSPQHVPSSSLPPPARAT